jgi:hypothetical protein
MLTENYLWESSERLTAYPEITRCLTTRNWRTPFGRNQYRKVCWASINFRIVHDRTESSFPASLQENDGLLAWDPMGTSRRERANSSVRPHG